ncbi:phage regulatory CII family protein [Janthinobacterium fluminis]|uniref:Phage regulatory CII family protein n=1 Tax=Janthinobacterium fluminis TaxID=2987524 RepID=A0ABT5JV01_9BURK|nr:phage regulatory CII family protein [Janthinobacterium fluminis]MDC8756240.1 phage regulatory CII family protein [Janthinobacterium fluminis]
MNIADAFHKTVHAALGGCEALAVRLGMSAQVLRNKANPNNASNKALLEDADRVMGITGDFQVLHALAANHGFVCIKVEADVSASDMAVLEVVTRVWSANGDVGAEVHRALADGRVEKREVVKVEVAIYQAQRALLELRGRLYGMAEK